MNDLYFDWAATAPRDPEILKESTQIDLDFWANPSSQHQRGQLANKKLLEARDRCAKALNVTSKTIYFCSGGTEADQFPFLSLLLRPEPGSIIVSAIEHPAVLKQAEIMKTQKWNIITVYPNSSGIIEPEEVKAKLQDDTCLVSIQAVNNEVGSIQKIKEIGLILEEWGKTHKKPRFHVDCVQAAGKTQIDLIDWKADSAAFSGHKIGAPRGIGILYLKERMEPFLRGGEQELGIRPGTENLAGAWAFSKALEQFCNKPAIEKEGREKAKLLIEGLKNINDVKIIPEDRKSDDLRFSPWVIQISLKNIPGEVAVRGLGNLGVFVSTGSACSSKKKSRPVLNAMGIDGDMAQNALRFSFGPATTIDEIKKALEITKDFIQSF